MKCKECKHDTDDVSHDRCRTHAFCSVDARYDRTPCAICADLWERAANSDDPEDAIIAWNLLRKWIGGFARNSKQSECKSLDFLTKNFNVESMNYILHYNLYSDYVNLTGPAGVSHWAVESQRDHYQELYVLNNNFELIVAQDNASQVGVQFP